MKKKNGLTNATHSQQSCRIFGWLTIRKERFHHVRAERKGHDCLRTGTHNHALDPQPYKCHEGTKRFHDVRIVGTGFLNHCSQFGVTVSAHLKKYKYQILFFISFRFHLVTKTRVSLFNLIDNNLFKRK